MHFVHVSLGFTAFRIQVISCEGFFLLTIASVPYQSIQKSQPTNPTNKQNKPKIYPPTKTPTKTPTPEPTHNQLTTKISHKQKTPKNPTHKKRMPARTAPTYGTKHLILRAIYPIHLGCHLFLSSFPFIYLLNFFNRSYPYAILCVLDLFCICLIASFCDRGLWKEKTKGQYLNSMEALRKSTSKQQL